MTHTNQHIISDKEYSRKLAKHLLNINAVLLRPSEPFTWSSGWNSPIYCDNRLTLRYPSIRKEIASAFNTIIRKHFSEIDVITGTATSGIPHAAWVAQNLDLPLAYVRAKSKSYGLAKQIEGGVKKGEKTVVIEDLISTGSSALSVVDALNFIGADVPGVLAIFSYGFDQANECFARRGIPLYVLTDYATLIDVALEESKITTTELEQLNRWRETPETWPK
jgi:orotate phosphoribosyltransferase